MDSNSKGTWLSPISTAGTATNSFQSDSSARPRSAPSSKTLLTMALLEAQSAVQMDHDGDVAGALEAYGRAVVLLSRVMEASSSVDEEGRLRAIHDSYLFRIHLLSTPPTPPTPSSPTSILSTEIIVNSTTTVIDNKAPGPSLYEPNTLPHTHTPPSVAANEGHHESGPSRTSRGRAASTSAADTAVMRTAVGTTVTAESPSISTPASRRVTKHTTETVPSTLFAAEQPIRRPRAESIPTPGPSSTHNGQGTGYRQGRHHARTHTGDLVAAAGHLQIQAHHRLPSDVRKSKSKELLSTPVPIHPAPTIPLPPTPDAHMQESTISSPTTPSESVSMSGSGFASSPPPPNLASSQVFLAFLGNTGSGSNPGKSSTPPTNYARRIDSLMPSARSTHQQHHQKEQEQEQEQEQTPMTTVAQQTISISSENSPEKEKTTTTNVGSFYEDVDMLSDEWLPNLSSKGFASAESLQDSQTHPDDPYPRERISLKGTFNRSQSPMETAESRILFVSTSEDDTQKLGGATPAHHNHHHYQHQRTFSQPSLVHQPSQPTLSKRTPEVPQAVKAQGQQSTRIQSPPPQRPTMLRSQSNFSQSSAGSSSAEKLWSSGSHSPHNGHTSTMTLFEVISDDPFGGMSFPLPPPSIEPPPSDPFFRCFWLMRNLEQTMTSGGFITRKLYVPRQIWYQRTLVRLPAVETKINVCQTLAGMLDRMITQSKKGLLNLQVEAGGGAAGDQSRVLLLKELEAIEAATLHAWAKLSKKLSFIHRPGKHPGTSTGVGGNLSISTQQQHGHGHAQQDENQGLTSGGNGATSFDWLGNEDSPGTSSSSGSPLVSSTSSVFSPDKPMGHKRGVSMVGTGTDLKSQWKSFSKSVQKSIGNDKVEDTSAYTEAIIRLFQSSYILESMLKHYNALAPFQTHIQIVNRLRRLCEFLNLVVCAFVVRDLGELMSKYTKRIGAWVAE
ncbi:hypothetical protein BGZ51_000860 [Haplosporangium sp. Z 767]|nr:hypothetical protein BGZ51_000860 [Haplosporangium sp. Z 767]KAF9190705.1 hypothetical protein BGZ50_009846 [Haplosporangium sp. Z 11]